MVHNVAKANNCDNGAQCCAMLKYFQSVRECVKGINICTYCYMINQASVLFLQQVLHFCNSPGAMQ